MANITTNNNVLSDGFILALYSLTFIIGVTGNLVVLKVIFFQRNNFASRSGNTAYLYLGNLAVSDLLSAVTIPLQFLFCSRYILENFIIGAHICVTLKSIQVLTYNVSVLTMVAISIDRYQLIHYPLEASSKRLKPRYALPIVWLLAILFAITCLVSMKVSEYFETSNNLIGCRILFNKVLPISSLLFRKIRVTILVICFYFIPLIITGVLYMLCLVTISKRSAIGESNQALCDGSKHRTMKILMVILLAFAFCWLPVHIKNLHDFYSPSRNLEASKNMCNSSAIYSIVYWLAISSCCYNPFIYSWFNKNFRKAFRTQYCQQIQLRPRAQSNSSQVSHVFR